ncbi:MAG TPA: hypothetical protein VGJ00_09780 [Rhabdochlamydiaceae bacterium]|jgi:hypothetical protein
MSGISSPYNQLVTVKSINLHEGMLYPDHERRLQKLKQERYQQMPQLPKISLRVPPGTRTVHSNNTTEKIAQSVIPQLFHPTPRRRDIAFPSTGEITYSPLSRTRARSKSLDDLFPKGLPRSTVSSFAQQQIK